MDISDKGDSAKERRQRARGEKRREREHKRRGSKSINAHIGRKTTGRVVCLPSLRALDVRCAWSQSPNVTLSRSKYCKMISHVR